MRAQGCQRHYCGVCKTIGAEYGDAPRLLLNHDTVLVAEIMSALDPQPAVSPALVRRNCFRLPKPEETPMALRYAAATTVLLAGAKVRNHVADTGRAGWRLLDRVLGKRYQIAAARLGEWGLPVADIERELASQAERESSPGSLDHLAAPTALATSQVCGNAARLAGRPDAEAAMSRFGTAFGKLIYVLDAWHDYKGDRSFGQFNALHALYGERENGRAEIDAAAGAVSESIEALPIAATRKQALQSRFRANLTVAMTGVKVKGKRSDCLPDFVPDACDVCCCNACDCCDCGCCDCGGCDCGGCDCG